MRPQQVSHRKDHHHQQRKQSLRPALAVQIGNDLRYGSADEDQAKHFAQTRHLGKHLDPGEGGQRHHCQQALQFGRQAVDGSEAQQSHHRIEHPQPQVIGMVAHVIGRDQ